MNKELTDCFNVNFDELFLLSHFNNITGADADILAFVTVFLIAFYCFY